MKYLNQIMLHCIKTYGTLIVTVLYSPFIGALVIYYGQNNS